MGSWERQGLGEEMVREGVRKSKEQRGTFQDCRPRNVGVSDPDKQKL